MYLDGQLPYGPPSNNPGAPPTPAFADPGPENTFTIPGATGPDGVTTVVSPTIANVPGIVQYPQVVPTSRQFEAPRTDTASYSSCGDYGADGSLSSIANRAGRGMGLKGLGSMCQSGDQEIQALTVKSSSWSAGWAFAAGVAAIALLTRKGR